MKLSVKREKKRLERLRLKTHKNRVGLIEYSKDRKARREAVARRQKKSAAVAA